MRGQQTTIGSCFPTGRFYPGIADLLAKAVRNVEGVAEELVAGSAWATQPMAVVDFETTGLDPTVDRVIEVGVVFLDAGMISARHNFLVNPGMPVPEEARSVHGITDEELASAPPFEGIAAELRELLAGRIPVAYNAGFDRRFLDAELARLGLGSGDEPPAFRPKVDWIDPLVWSRELGPDEKSHKLGDVCERLGVELVQAHRAAGDAEATGRVLLALSDRMPRTYGELVRLQRQAAARHEAEMSVWRNRRMS
ncbi:MAG TPA: 3'-5' exonuclease [Polyangiaceae bacterium LLY-WYZ-14_1]|nr:3'-5' exonuclease [Polyangiaceae bacterium LLY-WYZ-14_1]